MQNFKTPIQNRLSWLDQLKERFGRFQSRRNQTSSILRPQFQANLQKRDPYSDKQTSSLSTSSGQKKKFCFNIRPVDLLNNACLMSNQLNFYKVLEELIKKGPTKYPKRFFIQDILDIVENSGRLKSIKALYKPEELVFVPLNLLATNVTKSFLGKMFVPGVADYSQRHARNLACFGFTLENGVDLIQLIMKARIEFPLLSVQVNPNQGIPLTHVVFIQQNHKNCSEPTGIYLISTALNFVGDTPINTNKFTAAKFNKYRRLSATNPNNVMVSGYLLQGRLTEDQKKGMLKIYDLTKDKSNFSTREKFEAFLNKDFQFKNPNPPRRVFSSEQELVDLAIYLTSISDQLLQNVENGT